MKFETKSVRDVDRYNDALTFLQDAYDKGTINEIENMDALFDELDILGYIEYLQDRLKVYHIDY